MQAALMGRLFFTPCKKERRFPVSRILSQVPRGTHRRSFLFLLA